ncbi:MAG: substrate-binding domain-containing protein [Steroidobacteraceae bacterium]
MNDDFLHRIRAEPPRAFMADLKARLDRQLPPAATAPRRSLFRVLVFGLLFGGSVFAISLLTVNGIPDFTRAWVEGVRRGSTPKPDATGHSDVTHPGRNSWADFSASPGITAPEGPQHAGQAPNPSRGAATPASATNTAPSVQSVVPGASTRPPQVITLVTPKTLQAYLKSRVANFARPYRADVLVTAADNATEALAQLCSKPATVGNQAAAPDIAVIARRITRAEFETCTTNIGNIAEVQMEHQALVLARSKLYGTLALSARDLFLALAAEIPDPEHPGALIRNPNTTWDRINASLGAAPIEVFGPPEQSTAGIALRETLLQAGCDSVPALAALSRTDGARYQQVCKTLRKDGAYVEMREEVTTEALQTLQSHPDAIGVLGYAQLRFFGSIFKNNYMLIINPVGGVEPTPQAIADGTYPGSRTLYLYLNQRRASYGAAYLTNWLADTSVEASTLSVAMPEVKGPRKYLGPLPDLKLQTTE